MRLRYWIILLVIFSAIFLSQARFFPDNNEERTFTTKIIQRQQVTETKHWRILLDYAPITPGHLLAVAKSEEKVYRTLDELPKEAYTDLAEVTQKITRVFRDQLNSTNYIVLQKNGREAGQTMHQVHLHYIPIQSSKWRMWGQMRVFFRILFGSNQDRNLEQNVAKFRTYFAQ